MAWRHGHEKEWTSADVEEARQQANEAPRPGRDSAAEQWQARCVPNQAERESFAKSVREEEEQLRDDRGVGALPTSRAASESTAVSARAARIIVAEAEANSSTNFWPKNGKL